MVGTWADAAEASTNGEIAVDQLSAFAPPSAPIRFSSGDLGLRLRGTVSNDRGLSVWWDYHGREPLYGTTPVSPQRLVYRMEVVGDAGPVEVGAGRFMAPSVVLLPVDGARLRLRTPGFELALFAGRRAISTSRTNVPWNRFLPAGGLSVRVGGQTVELRLSGAAYQDLLVLGTPLAPTPWLPYSSGNATLSGLLRPTDVWTFGVQSTASPRLVYEYPTTETLTASVTVDDVYQVVGFAEARPSADWRFGFNVAYQRALVTASGPVVLSPDFEEVSVRADRRLDGIGWLRADARERLRGVRTETDLGLTVDLIDLGSPFVRLAADATGIGGPDQPDDIGLVDRAHWRASGGWRAGALDLEAGASLLQRAAVPVSGISGALLSVDATRSTNDLSPFVLEAQTVCFARAFYGSRRWFGGLDLEVSPASADIRSYVQIGVEWDRCRSCSH